MAVTQEQIRARFIEGTEAWNRGDLDAYLAGYWDSQETLYITSGTILRGIDAIRGAYTSRFDSPEKMGKLDLKDLEIDLLTESDALVVGTWSHTAGRGVRRGVFTVHMKKIGGEWVIVNDHTSAMV
jgi:ketosteroid isomerase-like protein